MYVTYLNLPKIPTYLLELISNDFLEVSTNNAFPKNDITYSEIKKIYASISPPKDLNVWLCDNVSKNLKWFVQVIKKDLPLHKDIGTACKLNYVFELGGSGVETSFYDDDKKLVYSEVIVPHRWHILKVDTLHRAWNIENDKIRLSVSGSVF